MTEHVVDLNADLGEGYGPYRVGDDAAMLAIVTSANVACGFHGGDPEIIHATFLRARENNVAVGAHPGFPDLWGFGRRIMPFSNEEIERQVAYQLGAAWAMARHAGHRISYVKPHGALANLTERDARIADAVIDAVTAIDPGLPVLAIAFSQLELRARARGLPVLTEIFADRGYDEDGHLLSRALPGAVLHDSTHAARRAVDMIRAGAIETVSGRHIPTRIDSLCVHGDSPAALDMARAVRAALQHAGIAVRAPIL